MANRPENPPPEAPEGPERPKLRPAVPNNALSDTGKFKVQQPGAQAAPKQADSGEENPENEPEAETSLDWSATMQATRDLDKERPATDFSSTVRIPLIREPMMAQDGEPPTTAPAAAAPGADFSSTMQFGAPKPANATQGQGLFEPEKKNPDFSSTMRFGARPADAHQAPAPSLGQPPTGAPAPAAPKADFSSTQKFGAFGAPPKANDFATSMRLAAAGNPSQAEPPSSAPVPRPAPRAEPAPDFASTMKVPTAGGPPPPTPDLASTMRVPTSSGPPAPDYNDGLPNKAPTSEYVLAPAVRLAPPKPAPTPVAAMAPAPSPRPNQAPMARPSLTPAPRPAAPLPVPKPLAAAPRPAPEPAAPRPAPEPARRAMSSPSLRAAEPPREPDEREPSVIVSLPGVVQEAEAPGPRPTTPPQRKAAPQAAEPISRQQDTAPFRALSEEELADGPPTPKHIEGPEESAGGQGPTQPPRGAVEDDPEVIARLAKFSKARDKRAASTQKAHLPKWLLPAAIIGVVALAGGGYGVHHAFFSAPPLSKLVPSPGMDKPSNKELRALYSKGLEGEALARAAGVKFNYKGTIRCSRASTTDDCIRYEFFLDDVSGLMVVRKGEKGWERLTE